MIRPDARCYGGIDLGGTKIQAAILDEDHSVLGSARRADAHDRRTGRRGRGDGGRAARRGQWPPRWSPRRWTGSGLDPRARSTPATSRARAICPAGKATFPLASTLEQALGCEVEVGNDVQVATDAEFKLGAGRLYRSLLGVFWGTGVGGGLILDGRPWTGPGSGRRDRAHRGEDRRRPLHLRAARLHGGLRRARRDGTRMSQSSWRRAARPSCSS